VIVTAGAQEKRDLMIALGAEYAFDSRSGAFVDDVMRVTSGQGVSVVLTGQSLKSLSGEEVCSEGGIDCGSEALSADRAL